MTNEHLEFLPAALEIQETPPLLMAHYMMWAIMLFFLIALLWAYVGEVEIVSVASGKIVPSGRVKIIQPLETGVIRKIHVKEGSHVTKGDVLIEMDTTLTKADQNQEKNQALVLRLEKLRLLSLLEVVENDHGSNIVMDTPVNASPSQVHILHQRTQYELSEFKANREALKDEKHQREAELETIRQRIKQLNATIPLITERAQSLSNLLTKKMAPRVDWLKLEQERIELVNEREIQKNNIKMVSASINNIKRRLTAQKAEFNKTMLTELADVENRMLSIEQTLIKVGQRVNLQKLIAPVTGKVHHLVIHTIGGIVTPAQELMKIIPENESLEIEAWLPNKDVGFVHEGQEAAIKVETFPFTKYGLIEGELASLSNDATQDENLGLVYAMRVKMLKTTMQIKEKVVNLSPGMAVTVELQLGKRRLIEFLLSPLLRYKNESMKER